MSLYVGKGSPEFPVSIVGPVEADSELRVHD